MKKKILDLVMQAQEPNTVWHCNVLSDEALISLGTDDKRTVAHLTRELIAEGKLDGSVASDNSMTQVYPLIIRLN